MNTKRDASAAWAPAVLERVYTKGPNTEPVWINVAGVIVTGVTKIFDFTKL